MTNERGVTGREHQMSPEEQSVWPERSGGLWSIKLEEAGAALSTPDSPGHSTGIWLQPREVSTLAGTERPGGSPRG